MANGWVTSNGDFDTSLLVNRAQVYDSFLQLVSGVDRYRLKSLQSSQLILSILTWIE